MARHCESEGEMMNKRKMAATVTLAALPLTMIVAQSPILAAPLATYGWATGMGGTDALLFGVAGAVMCSFIPGIGSTACGITGAV